MDFYLDNLLNLPHVTVLSYQQQEEFIFLKLDLLNEGIFCPHCNKYPTEELEWMDKGRNYTKRYEEYIYENVKELTVEQVSVREQLSPDQVQNSFSRLAQKKRLVEKIGQCQKS